MSKRTDEELREMIAELKRLSERADGLPLGQRLEDLAVVLCTVCNESLERAEAMAMILEMARGRPVERQDDLAHALDWYLGKSESLITPDGLRLPRKP